MDVLKPQVVSAGFLMFRKTPVSRAIELGTASERLLPGGGAQPPRLQFLLMKHVDRWDLPKGHVDEGETLEQAALRELWEETSILPTDVWVDNNVKYSQYYQVQSRKKVAKLKQLVIFLGWLKKDCPIVPTEHEGYTWIDWTPPHKIQEKTIDPLLVEIGSYLSENPLWPFSHQKFSL